jgi:DNA-binding XRE family transcriptional regulator
MTSNLKAIRTEKRMTKTELSTLASVSRPTIDKLENDDFLDCDLWTIRSLAMALQVSVKVAGQDVIFS